MWKLFLKAAIQGFFHDILAAKQGETILKDHVKILDVQEHQVITEVDINEGTRYKVTVERLQS